MSEKSWMVAINHNGCNSYNAPFKSRFNLLLTCDLAARWFFTMVTIIIVCDAIQKIWRLSLVFTITVGGSDLDDLDDDDEDYYLNSNDDDEEEDFYEDDNDDALAVIQFS